MEAVGCESKLSLEQRGGCELPGFLDRTLVLLHVACRWMASSDHLGAENVERKLKMIENGGFPRESKLDIHARTSYTAWCRPGGAESMAVWLSAGERCLLEGSRLNSVDIHGKYN